MDSPNGYRQLVHAGHSLTGREILGRAEAASEAEIADFLKSNQATLDRARSFLGEECRVPVLYDASWMGQHDSDFGPLRDLARGFELEMKAAVERGALGCAVQIGLDLLMLANAARCGGLVIDLLVAIAFESMAIEKLRTLRSRLDAVVSVELLNAMLRLEAAREPFVDIVKRDVVWEQTAQVTDNTTASNQQESPTSENEEPDDEANVEVQQLLKSIREMPVEELRKMEKQQDDRCIAQRRLMAIDVALRAFEQAQGEYPAELCAIVPEFIDHLPPDPFTGGPFKYRRIGDGFLLYSPGPSSRDHGGQFGHWLAVQAGACDLCLDVGDYNLSCPVRRARNGIMTSFISMVRRVLMRS